MKYYYSFIAVLLSLFYVHGQRVNTGTLNQGTILSIISDQDILAPNNEDRNYTMGFNIDVTNKNMGKWFTHYPLSLLHKITPCSGKFENYSSGMGLIGTAFTPEKLDTTGVVIGDRPYAFLLALSTRQITKYTKESMRDVYQAWTINYGLFGTYLGREVQSAIHRSPAITRPVPEGWDNQIGKEGPKFTMLIDFNRFQTFNKYEDPASRIELKSCRGADAGWMVGGSAGYYMRVYGGIGGRYGLIDKNDIYNWFSAFNSLGTASMNLQQVPEANRRKEFFVFGQFLTTVMARNSMLVGRLFYQDDEVYRLEEDWVNPLVYEFVFGLGYSVKWVSSCRPNKLNTLALQFKNTIRTAEFDSGIFPERNHYFGSVAIVYSL